MYLFGGSDYIITISYEEYLLLDIDSIASGEYEYISMFT